MIRVVLRLATWLIPELALVSDKERRVQYRALAVAWIGAVALAILLTLADIALDLTAGGELRLLLRPVVFTLVTLSCTALVMRASFRQSGTFTAERVSLNRALHHQALFDALTDLPNRRQFHDRLQRMLDANVTSRTGFALLVIDLDGFKDINDTLGHAVGDGLLQEIARRLQTGLHPLDMVARVGGDEFVALLTARQEQSAVQVARRLLEAVAVPMSLDGRPVHVSASIGVAVCSAEGSTADLLLRRADLAMYVAKRTGGTYAVYGPDIEPAEARLAA